MDDKTLRDYYRFLISRPAHKAQPDIDASAADFLSTAVENILEYLFGSTYTVGDAENRINKTLAGTEIKKYIISRGVLGARNRLKLSRFVFLSNSYLAFYFGVWEYFTEELIDPALGIAQRRPGDTKIVEGDIQKIVDGDEEISKLYSASTKYKKESGEDTESEAAGEICKALHLFYDCYSLFVSSRRLQYAFLEAAGRGNTTLSALIKNFFVNRYQASKGIIRNPTPRYIDGPMSLSYHTSDYYGKRIYIFGELHGYKNDCRELNKKPSTNITNFFKQVFETADRFIDFYLEYPAYEDIEIFKGGRNPERGYIIDMMEEFSVCFDPTKRERGCKWGGARFHFSDTRYLFYAGQIKAGKIDIISINSELFYKPLTKETLEIINFLTESMFEPNIFFKELWKQIAGHPFLKKELSRTFIRVDLIESSLKKFLPERLRTLKTYELEFRKIGGLEVGSALEAKQTKLLLVLLVNIQASFMDIYQLARMFKIFKESKERPSGQYNLISYSGDGHSDFFRFALGGLGFTTEFSLSEKVPLRCLDMKGRVLDFGN